MINILLIVGGLIIAFIGGYRYADTNNDGVVDDSEIEKIRSQAQFFQGLFESTVDYTNRQESALLEIIKKFVKVADYKKANNILEKLIDLNVVREKNEETGKNETTLVEIIVDEEVED